MSDEWAQVTAASACVCDFPVCAVPLDACFLEAEAHNTSTGALRCKQSARCPRQASFYARGLWLRVELRLPHSVWLDSHVQRVRSPWVAAGPGTGRLPGAPSLGRGNCPGATGSWRAPGLRVRCTDGALHFLLVLPMGHGPAAAVPPLCLHRRECGPGAPLCDALRRPLRHGDGVLLAGARGDDAAASAGGRALSAHLFCRHGVLRPALHGVARLHVWLCASQHAARALLHPRADALARPRLGVRPCALPAHMRLGAPAPLGAAHRQEVQTAHAQGRWQVVVIGVGAREQLSAHVHSRLDSSAGSMLSTCFCARPKV
eukprot:6192439-Pleurochrysis_carterae.AAC.1